MVVAGTIFGHFCGECGREVMIAPSGQAVLQEAPETPILCMYCYEAMPFDPREKRCFAARTQAEMDAEAAAVQLNPRKKAS